MLIIYSYIVAVLWIILCKINHVSLKAMAAETRGAKNEILGDGV